MKNLMGRRSIGARRFVACCLAAGAVSLAALSATSADASVIITFDDVAPNTILSSYVSAGIAFNGGPGGEVRTPPNACNCNANIDPIGSSVAGDPLVMRVDGGGTFDLLGFTFGIRPTSLGDAPAAGFVEIQFWYDGGQVDVERLAITRFGPVSIDMIRNSVRRVAFLRGEIRYDTSTCSFCTHSGASIGPFTFDNIEVDNILLSQNPVEPPLFAPVGPTALPEPTAWALMILGFTGVGAMLRSRRLSMTGA